MCLCVCICTTCMQDPVEVKEDIRFSGSGVMGCYELPYWVGEERQSWESDFVLCESRKYS